MCMIDNADGTCDVWRERDYKARKAYRCSECHRAIIPGERYRRIFSVYDGSASTYFACEHCAVAQEWLSRECHGFMAHGVLEDIHEHHTAASMGEKYLPQMWLGRVVVGMRWQWRAPSGRMLPVPVLPAKQERPPPEPVARLSWAHTMER